MKILKAKPFEQQLIQTLHRLKFLKALILITSFLLPFIALSEDDVSIYFLSSILIFNLFLFFYYDEKFQKMKKVKSVFKQNKKMFEIQFGESLSKDFFLRFNKKELHKGKKILFEVDGITLVKFEVSDLLIKLGDNHFVILYNKNEISNVDNIECFLLDKDGNVLSSKKLSYLFDIEMEVFKK